MEIKLLQLTELHARLLESYELSDKLNQVLEQYSSLLTNQIERTYNHLDLLKENLKRIEELKTRVNKEE